METNDLLCPQHSFLRNQQKKYDPLPQNAINFIYFYIPPPHLFLCVCSELFREVQCLFRLYREAFCVFEKSAERIGGNEFKI